MKADYTGEWQAYRKVRNQALGVFVAAVCLVVIATGSSSMVSYSIVWPVTLSVIGAFVLAAAIVVWMRAESWRCPKCGRRFVSKWMSGWAIFLVGECSNCGLPKYAHSGNGKVDLGA